MYLREEVAPSLYQRYSDHQHRSGHNGDAGQQRRSGRPIQVPLSSPWRWKLHYCARSFYDSALCFVCAHLAAHKENVAGRNADYRNIIERSLFPAQYSANSSSLKTDGDSPAALDGFSFR